MKRGDQAMADIAAAIGPDAAQLLSRAFGGTELYVPARPGDHHPITVAIGREAADRLAVWIGGERLDVPKLPLRQNEVRALRQNSKLTVGQIAVHTRYSERHVYRLLGEDTDDRQTSLFND